MGPLSTLQFLAVSALALNAAATPSVAGPAAPAVTGPLGNIIVSSGIAPETQTLPPRAANIFPGSQRVKIRYGPYNMPGTAATSAMGSLTHEQGTMNTVGVAMKKPCAGTCGITRMQAGLEYANGSIANTANGAWLHHVVMLATGTGKKDVTCASTWGLVGERFFSSGNERTPTPYADLEKGTVKSAYPITSATGFGMQLELMNMAPATKQVYFTVDYEYVPTMPALQTKALWLDVTNCGASFVGPPANQKKFTLKMNQWSSTVDGTMLGVAGHLHDGGVNVNVYQNSRVICDSVATYSVAGEGSHAMSNDGTSNINLRRDGPHDDSMPHIDSMKTCNNLGPVKKNDKIYIDATYDFNKFMGMGDATGMAPVMGIAILFVATAA